jgi:very-short-patch-repair endonuclease
VLYYNLKLKKYSRKLRKDMTDAERLLWSKLRNKQLKGLQVYRQRIIGNYIVDFYCPKAKLIIEVDGSQHYISEGKEQDKIRDEYMKGIGFAILRVTDRDIFENSNGVVERIFEML